METFEASATTGCSSDGDEGVNRRCIRVYDRGCWLACIREVDAALLLRAFLLVLSVHNGERTHLDGARSGIDLCLVDGEAFAEWNDRYCGYS